MDELLTFLDSLGGWSWWVLGLVLLVLELLVPGVYFLWLGVAAFAVGASTLLIDWSWQWQVGSFAVLSVVSVVLSRMFLSNRPILSDRPLLNRRAEALIGRAFVLDEPIVNGRGRVRVGDSLWRVAGADCPAGTRIRVEAVSDGVLEVAADATAG